MPEFSAEALTLARLLSESNTLRIPEYQRPYSWTDDHARQLLDDVTIARDDALAAGGDGDYFLGTILLIRHANGAPVGGDEPRVPPSRDVVDGQQRLVTLSVILAVLRDVADDRGLALGHDLDDRIWSGAGADRHPRLTTDPGLAPFFESFVARRGALIEMPEESPLPPDRQRLIDVREVVAEDLVARDDDDLISLAAFLLEGCRFALITTGNVDRAHRIFTVINNRGLPLARADILKAEILGGIADARRAPFVDRWRRLETMLGSGLDDIFSYIRSIEAGGRERIVGSILALVAAHGGAERFFEDCLEPYASLLARIRRPSQDPTLGDDVRRLLEHLSWLGSSEWVAPLMLFWRQVEGDTEKLVAFLRRLDRLAYGARFLGLGGDKRQTRFNQVLAAVRAGEGLAEGPGPLDLSRDEQRLIFHNIRSLHERSQLTCKLLLLRINDALAGRLEGVDAASYTVEHVLPRKPAAGSQWRSWFPATEEREQCTHSLGNLVLVSRERNDRARNLELAQKLAIYFAPGGQRPPLITRELEGMTEWRAKQIREREQRFLAIIADLWQLDAGKWSTARGGGDTAQPVIERRRRRRR